MKRTIPVLILLIFSTVLPVQASITSQDELAAVLRVIYPGVELRRMGTEAWIRLRQGAEMPIGAHDMLRTDERGRALIWFADGVEMLLLPLTEQEITRFEPDGASFSLISALATGRVIVTNTGAAQMFKVETDRLLIMPDAAHVAISVEDGAVRVVVASGSVVAGYGDAEIELAAHDGLRMTDEPEIAHDLPTPASFAHLDSALDSCPGTALATIRDSVNVRQGPGDGYAIIGEYVNGAPVEIVATTARSDRYRVRYRSSFGWMVSNGVISNCRDLPVLPYDTVEIVYGVIEPTLDDFRLLEPFFGGFLDDQIFYPR